MKTIIMRDVVRRQHNVAQLTTSAGAAIDHCASAGGRLPKQAELEYLCALDKRACSLERPRPVIVRPQIEWVVDSHALPPAVLAWQGLPYRCVCVIDDDMFVPSGWLDITASLPPGTMPPTMWEKFASQLPKPSEWLDIATGVSQLPGRTKKV